jgi:hypothetical protein
MTEKELEIRALLNAIPRGIVEPGPVDGRAPQIGGDLLLRPLKRDAVRMQTVL